MFEEKNQRVKYIELQEKISFLQNELILAYGTTADKFKIQNSLVEAKDKLSMFERKNPEVLV